MEKCTQRLTKPDSEPITVRWGTATIESHSQIKIIVGGFPNPLLPKLQRRMIVGRAKEGNNPKVDIDLSSYFAAERGVSRVHAALDIVGKNLMVTDLSSTNGSFLNGQPLSPYQRRIVRDNDEICLGELLMYISFV